MEQNPTATEPIINNNTPNNKKGWIITTAIISIVAVCSIGFSIYSVVQSSQKDNQISDLKNQVDFLGDELSSANSKQNETTNYLTTTNGDTKDYIYVGEWGLKIKISEELLYLDYQISHSSDISTLCLNGGGPDDKNYTADVGMLNIEVMSIGCINKGANAEKDFSINGDNFWYTSYQGDFGPNITEEVFERNEKVIREMLTNPANYSPI